MIVEAPQRFEGTKAVQKVIENKLEELQKTRVTVTCESNKLSNTSQFKYLNSVFAADGDQRYDVCHRISPIMSRMGKLTHVFNSKVSFNLKMKVHKCVVYSLFTFGSEAWNLDQTTMTTINGVNARTG